MSKSPSILDTPLRDQLDRLAVLPPTDAPVLSMYLDLRPDQHGRDNFRTFLRKRLPERAVTLDGDHLRSFEQDVARITSYLENDLRPSANALAIFACSAQNGLFEALQLDVPIEGHWFFVGRVPHLYPLARLNDQHPRYAAILVNTNAARLFVFSLGATESERQVINTKTRRTTMGGWSQARYQRHVENFHLHHMKEVVDVLDRTVRAEGIQHIVVAGDDTARPALMEQLPSHLREKVLDAVRLGIDTPVHEVLAETMAVMRRTNAKTDAEHVQAMLDAWRAGGLAAAGPDETTQALERGQVEELLITVAPDAIHRPDRPPDAAAGSVAIETSAPAGAVHPERWTLADDLVTKAHQTAARIRFIEDPRLLRPIGGVGALLRFRI